MKRLFYCAAFVAAMGLFTTANAQSTATTKKEVKKEQCDKKDGKACCKAGDAKKECCKTADASKKATTKACCKTDSTKKSCCKETAAKKK